MTHDPANTDLPAALRMQLRGLRKDVPPAGDLWPGIAARLAEQPRDAPAARPRRLRAFPALATAAALALAVGLGWQLRPEAPAPTGNAPAPSVASAPASLAPASAAPLVVEAEAMTLEYRGALREVSAVRPATAEYAALLELDASARAVREALALDPDALFLLERLQRIYAQRLSLTLRLARV